jgi:spermidine/putrescine-binding protein
MHKSAFEAFAKSKGMSIELQVVKPDITDDKVIFENVRQGKVDVLTPTESFFFTRGKKLLNLVAEVDPAKVPGYEAIPSTLRNSEFHINEGKHYGIVFMAGYYGLYYNSKKVSAPNQWDFLWSSEAKGKYSVSKDTYFVNAYISQWALDKKGIENAYDSSKFDKKKLGTKMLELAQNAHHLWEGEGNTKEQLDGITYTASWGF